MNPLTTYGPTLRRTREGRGFNLGEMARLLNVSVPRLSDIERNAAAPDPDMLRRLESLGMPVPCDAAPLVSAEAMEEVRRVTAWLSRGAK